MNRGVRVDGVMFSRGSEGVLRTRARTHGMHAHASDKSEVLSTALVNGFWFFDATIFAAGVQPRSTRRRVSRAFSL